jgi:hypothetical protein
LFSNTINIMILTKIISLGCFWSCVYSSFNMKMFPCFCTSLMKCLNVGGWISRCSTHDSVILYLQMLNIHITISFQTRKVNKIFFKYPVRAMTVQSVKQMKMAVFWLVTPCSLVEFYDQCNCPDDGSSKYPRNIDKLLPDYNVLQPRRQPTSY